MINLFRNIVISLCLGALSIIAQNSFAEENGKAKDLSMPYEDNLAAEEYSSDKQSTTRNNSVILIDKSIDQTQLKIDTKGPLAPYLGTGQKPAPAKEVIPILSKEEREQHLKNIHLETGIRANVNEKINVDLGYRFEKNLSLTEDHKPDNGQIRFGIKFKY